LFLAENFGDTSNYAQLWEVATQILSTLNLVGLRPCAFD